MFEMPKETEKGKKVTGTKRRSRMRKGGNHATTTDSSETEIKLPKAVMLAEMHIYASNWVRMVINWIGTIRVAFWST